MTVQDELKSIAAIVLLLVSITAVDTAQANGLDEFLAIVEQYPAQGRSSRPAIDYDCEKPGGTVNRRWIEFAGNWLQLATHKHRTGRCVRVEKPFTATLSARQWQRIDDALYRRDWTDEDHTRYEAQRNQKINQTLADHGASNSFPDLAQSCGELRELRTIDVDTTAIGGWLFAVPWSETAMINARSRARESLLCQIILSGDG